MIIDDQNPRVGHHFSPSPDFRLMLIQLLVVVQVTVRWFLGLNGGDGIVPAQPAIEINLGAACRTERVKFLQGGLAANGAGATWFKADRVDHQTLAEAVVIQV